MTYLLSHVVPEYDASRKSGESPHVFEAAMAAAKEQIFLLLPNTHLPRSVKTSLTQAADKGIKVELHVLQKDKNKEETDLSHLPSNVSVLRVKMPLAVEAMCLIDGNWSGFGILSANPDENDALMAVLDKEFAHQLEDVVRQNTLPCPTPAPTQNRSCALSL
jgi:hypothetical protein